MRFDAVCGGAYSAFSTSTENEEAINLYLSPVQSGEGKNQYALIKSPGLSLALDTAIGARVRGLWSINGTNYAVISDSIKIFAWVNTTGLYTVSSTLSPIANDGNMATMASNATQVIIVSGGVIYSIIAGVLATITWPGEPISQVGFLNEYFIFLPVSGKGFYYSEPGDANSGTAINFIAAEASSNLYTSLLIADEQIYLFGNQITQPFYNDTNDTSVPFKPNLSGVINQSVSPNFSPIQINNAKFWISQSRIAWMAVGYAPQQISTHAVENQWRTYSYIGDAVSMSLSFNGHMVWRICFPTANVTWQYDTSLPPHLAWTKQLYYNHDTATFSAHRAICSALDVTVGTLLVGDRESGKIYILSPDTYSDAGNRIYWIRRTPTIVNENKNTVYPGLELDIEYGVGNGTNDGSPEDDPQVVLRWSNDGGRKWTAGIARSMGKIGEYSKRLRWLGLGMGRERIFEISGTASVKTVINNAYLDKPQVLQS